jgi:hypothetical protein
MSAAASSPDDVVQTGPGTTPVPKAFPDGHFYSPLVDLAALEPFEEAVWAPRTSLPGIDFGSASHAEILTRAFPRQMPAYDYPQHLEDSASLTSFYSRNDQFSWLDARALFVLLRQWRPRRIVEVGSGYSTLLMCDQKRRYLGTATRLECVEPYPRAFLGNPSLGIDALHVKKVQEMPLELFTGLGAGDVLFIDSSHVAKTGSDVNFLYLEVLPVLRPGVRVHIHDIFLPLEYPREWVHEGRHWNEQYVLRAMLTHSARYRVLFGSTFARLHFPAQLLAVVDDPEVAQFGGGSLWLEVA